MQVGRIDALDRGKQVRVNAQLDDVLGFGGPRELGVRHFIDERAELRFNALDLNQEVRVTMPWGIDQGALIDNLDTVSHREQRPLDTLGNIKIGRDLGDNLAFTLEPFEIGNLVRNPQSLEELGLFAIVVEAAGRVEVGQVQHSSMLATQEVDQIACRKQQLPVRSPLHG